MFAVWRGWLSITEIFVHCYCCKTLLQLVCKPFRGSHCLCRECLNAVKDNFTLSLWCTVVSNLYNILWWQSIVLPQKMACHCSVNKAGEQTRKEGSGDNKDEVSNSRRPSAMLQLSGELGGKHWGRAVDCHSPSKQLFWVKMLLPYTVYPTSAGNCSFQGREVKACCPVCGLSSQGYSLNTCFALIPLMFAWCVFVVLI